MSDCDRVKSLIQKALNQHVRYYQVIYSLSIFFEGDQTGAAEDSKIFLDMFRCLGVEGESLRIPLSSPRFGGPGWEVNDRVAAFIKQGIQLDPDYPRTFSYDRTINPKLGIYNYLGESLEIIDCTRCAEVLSAVREDQSARLKGIDSTGKVTARTFTARLAALVSQRRGKGHESIGFLEAVQELKTQSTSNRMPNFKMLFVWIASAIRIPLLSPSSALVHGQSAILSSASLQQGDIIRAVFSMHMPSGIDSEGVQKLTDWLLKLDRQFGLHVSGVYPGNSTFLLIEAPRST